MSRIIRNEDFILRKADNKIELCPSGNSPMSSEYNSIKKHYLVKIEAEKCKKCEFLKQCPVKIKGNYGVIKISDKFKNIKSENNEIKKFIDSLQLKESFKNNFDKQINKAIQMGVVFSGFSKPPATNHLIDNNDTNQRETILILLDNIKIHTDINYSLHHIINGIQINLHNIEVALQKNNNIKICLLINKIENEVLSKVIDNIRILLEDIKKSSKKLQVYKILEIRKLATMLYCIIKNEVIPVEADKVLFEVYADENYETFFVAVYDDVNVDDNISFKWYYFLHNDMPEIIKRLQEINDKSINEKYDETTKQYFEYYKQATNYLENTKLDEAEILLKKIVSSYKIFDFTSGAYVNLSSIIILKNFSNNSNIWIEKAVKFLNKALEIKPSNKMAHVSFVLLYILLGDFINALTWLNKCNNKESLNLLQQQLQTYLEFLTYLIFSDNDYNRKLNNEDAYKFFNTISELYSNIEDNLSIQYLIARYYMYKEKSGIFKAYDIYKSFTDRYPDLFIGYMHLGEICSEGYLNRPFEQEEYCKKAIELIIKVKTTNKKFKNELDKCITVAETNLTTALISQKRYSEVLELTKNRVKACPNNTDIHNHALALYYLGNYDESIKYCERELYISEDETSYILLGMNYYSLKKYEESSEYYKKSLEFISTGNLSVYYNDENKNPLFSFVKESWQKNKLKEIYIPLIDCYFRIGNYINAKTIWMIAMREFPEDKAIGAWENIIESTLKDRRQIEMAETQCEKLMVELDGERKKNINKTNTVRQWAVDLMKLQGRSDASNLNDSDWEYFEKNIDDILSNMANEVDNNSISFDDIKNELKTKYPKLEPRSVEFLSTAEYLYKFNENNFIDFAPIMVEYCKAIELELRIILKKDNSMLGQSLKYISDFKIKPLYNIYSELNEIYYNRNGSAHIGVSTRKKVDSVRNLLFNKSVLQTLSQIK